VNRLLVRLQHRPLRGKVVTVLPGKAAERCARPLQARACSRRVEHYPTNVSEAAAQPNMSPSAYGAVMSVS